MIDLQRGKLFIVLTPFALALIFFIPTRDASAGYVSLSPSSSTISPGNSVVVTENVTFDASDIQGGYNLGGFDIAMKYDATVFAISNVSLGSLVISDFSGTFVTSTPGQLTGTAFTNDSGEIGVPVSVGQTGALLTFTLTALSNASPGQSVLNLIPKIENTYTDVVMWNPNTLDPRYMNFTKPVTNGYDNGVDATIQVLGAVPEPSSVVLFGFGGILIAFLVRHRNVKGEYKLN